MIIDIEYIKKKYPKCCVMVTDDDCVEINNKHYYFKLEEFKTLEEFEEKFDKVLNGLGYLIVCSNTTYYGYWKLIDQKYFIYMCIV